MKLDLLLAVPLLAAALHAQHEVLSLNDDGTLNTNAAYGAPTITVACQFTPGTAMTVTAAEVVTGCQTGTMSLAIYGHDAANNRPGTALAQAAAWTMLTTPAWQGGVFPAPIASSASTPYWLVWGRLPWLCQASLGTGAANVPFFSSDTYPPVRWNGGLFGTPLMQPFKLRLYSGPVCAGSFGRPYGTGQAASTGFVPNVGASGWPCLGNAFDLYLDNAVRNQPALLLIGPAVALNVGFGTIYASPQVTVNATTQPLRAPNGPPVGYATQTLRIPNDPILAGSMISFQWWGIEVSTQSLTFSHTPGITVTVQ